jgi:N-hydroxyarylamine O-acetyltransferase
MATDVDLAAYFIRVGYDGPRTASLQVLERLHRLHPEAIPFESLDPLLGRPVQIDPASIQSKLVGSARGGYCFEHNGLMLAVLRTMGFKVTPLAARVVWMEPEGVPGPPLTHMLLKVDLPDGPHLVDVGFGGQSPTAPLRLEPDIEQATAHGAYRLVQAGREFVLQTRLPDRWAPMYRFSEDAQSARDYELYNWFTATHPGSRFTRNLIAARVSGQERISLLNAELTRYAPEGVKERRVLAGPAEIHDALTGVFGLAVELPEIERIFVRLPPPGG